jgi:hypothetical protein
VFVVTLLTPIGTTPAGTSGSPHFPNLLYVVLLQDAS